MKILAKINQLKNWQVALIILVIGVAVFFTGLATPFQGDDIAQITTAVPVHSITNIRLFFNGGTFYNGGGVAPLTGIYYRPLETVFYSLIYTIFGAQAIIFHVIQLLVCIGSAFLLYLIFRYSFNAVLSLLLSVIFLVHPLNSQIVYFMSQVTDDLFMFFGLLALWLLLRFKSVRSLIPVVLCLFLSMLAKETAFMFVALALLYLFWFNRARLYKFIGLLILPCGAYLALRIHAVGLLNSSSIAPIDNLNFIGRMFTAPSIMLLNLSKFVFPWRLANAYYWVYPTFSVRHVLLPLSIDLAVIALVVYMAVLVRRQASKEQYFTYLFFAAWAFLGLVPYLQIIPIDETASEAWFYFSMVGWLGMIGVSLVAFQTRIQPKWFLAIAALIIGLFGVRTAYRGLDYRNPINLAYKNISVSPTDYAAYNDISSLYLNQGNFKEGKIYAEKSVNIYATDVNLNNLGVAQLDLGNYSGAYNAYSRVLKLKNGVDYNVVIDNLAGLTLVYGNPHSNAQFLVSSLGKFPKDSRLWAYLAIFDQQHGDNADAQKAIKYAVEYGQVPPSIYDNLMSNTPFTINLGNTGRTLYVK
ncbi:MAG: tetratricopeptide repeat protein [Candidatus Saccharimonadales bacterium]